MAPMTLEGRPTELERTLGVYDQTLPTNDNDVNSRLSELETSLRHHLAKFDLTSSWKECQDLADSLEESMLLRSHRHQSSSAASSDRGSVPNKPFLYRKQDVLANADGIGKGLDLLKQIRDLLLISNRAALTAHNDNEAPRSSTLPNVKPLSFVSFQSPTTATTTNKAISIEALLRAPIVTSSHYEYATPSRSRLEHVMDRVHDLTTRAKRVAERVDELVIRYCTVMDAVSEKIVLADEEITLLSHSS